MSEPSDQTQDPDRATAELLLSLGVDVDEQTRRILSLAWLTGYAAGIAYCGARPEQAGIR